MASEFVVSPLPAPQQAKRLLDYIRSLGHSLSEAAAQRICAQQQLQKESEKKVAARRLQAALATHGVTLGYQRTLEALAKMCGGTSWMRVRQQLLKDEVEVTGGRYALQVVQVGVDTPDDPDIGERKFSRFGSLAEVTTKILDLVQARWPKGTHLAVGRLVCAPAVLSLELQHSTGPWLKMHVVSTDPKVQEDRTGKKVEEHERIRIFVARLVRALEYSHPGLHVFGVLQPESLPPWYVFAPDLKHGVDETPFEGGGEMEVFGLMAGRGPMDVVEPGDGTLVLQGQAEGARLSVKPMWVSGLGGASKERLSAPLSPAQLRSLQTRLARLERVTGADAADFLMRWAYGRAGNSEGMVDIDPKVVDRQRHALELDMAQVAARMGVPLNDLLRAHHVKKADANLALLLATALQLTDPNELLLAQQFGHGGRRMEQAAALLPTIKLTHQWELIYGEGLSDEERREVEVISESIRDCVDLLQMADGPVNTGLNDATMPKRFECDIQGWLDELKDLGVALVVERATRFVRSGGDGLSGNYRPQYDTTLYFEKAELLRQA